MILVTFTHRKQRYAVECDCAASANLVYQTVLGVFSLVRINFSGRIGKNVVKLSEEEYSRMVDDIIYNE